MIPTFEQQAAVNKHKQQGDAVVFTGDFNCGSMEDAANPSPWIM